ncbi:hypothetical protein F0L74_10625 [Chitinophaga agrisoli]|uniref:Uncharacterized protein n=1 Tax=Chitinophaga agrisoli TaxID=2607653 RepID=A0A5B2VXJ2_9BACT|nr:hypothetical protein [Chitinophaga agrisoli]KAA2242967.1 hypothetical protein F0L74_10625 [Chitinophaga agrisoli]
MLKLPITVRIPSDDELDYRPDIEEILQKRRHAKIQEGYVLEMNENKRLPFRFQAAVNIDNPRLWNLLLALAATLPQKVSCVYGLHEEEAETTALLQKDFVLAQLEKYREELTQECRLEFGLLFQTKDLLLELSVTESKYIRYWGAELERFRLLMQSFHLPLVPGLAFVDEYPKIVTPLRDLRPAAKAPETVIHYLDQAFQVDRRASDMYYDQ